MEIRGSHYSRRAPAGISQREEREDKRTSEVLRTLASEVTAPVMPTRRCVSLSVVGNGLAAPFRTGMNERGACLGSRGATPPL